jgi:hypothetical protein
LSVPIGEERRRIRPIAQMQVAHLVEDRDRSELGIRGVTAGGRLMIESVPERDRDIAATSISR